MFDSLKEKLSGWFKGKEEKVEEKPKKEVKKKEVKKPKKSNEKLKKLKNEIKSVEEEIKKEKKSVEKGAHPPAQSKVLEDNQRFSADVSHTQEIIEEKLKKKADKIKEEVPVKFEVAKQKFEPDVEKIEEELEEKEEIQGVAITYFVHGTTEDNENNISTGQNQGKLSELGIEQSKKLPAQIGDKKFDVLFSSDLKRAVDSAEISFKGKYKIVLDKRLRECNYGKLNGAKEEEVNYEEHIDAPFPDGESLKDVEQRIREFLNYLYENYYGKHIAIVAHKAPQLAIEVLLSKKTWKEVISEDWRKKGKWQPGWNYLVSETLEKETEPEKKESFFGKLKKKVGFGKEEIKELEERAEKLEEEIEEKLEEKAKEKEEVLDKEEVEEEIEEKKGFFGRLAKKLTTSELKREEFNEMFEEFEFSLLENNVALSVVDKIKENLSGELVGKKFGNKEVEEKILEALKKSIDSVLIEGEDFIERIKNSGKEPFVILFFGINGSGKTTSIAKLAWKLKNAGIEPVLAAGDTFRAASIEQLETHAKKIGVEIVKSDYGKDPASVAFEAIAYAKKTHKKVVLIDTAGRMYTKSNLMKEMEKIVKVSQPDLKIFVGESITGNDATEQAKMFNETAGIDGIILSKADVDEKAGSILSVSFVTGKPILFLGVGQEYEDLQEFKKKNVLKNLGLED